MVTEATRNAMRANRAKDTKPELTVRQLLHRLGYRYRLHRRDLPGCPDIVFLRQRKVIFVHGCFWHQHTDPACKIARMPPSRQEFWGPKLALNVERDARSEKALENLGWRVLVLWECGLKDIDQTKDVLCSFLSEASS